MMTTPRTGVTSFETPGDTQLIMTRVVKAPKALAYQAYTVPKHLQQWMLGPDGWTMPICEFEPKEGGKWRYVWRKTDGTEMEMSGTVREIVTNERIVSTERWGPDWPETINTVAFAERDGYTTITTTVTYPSLEARDAALKTGMKSGADQSYARLERYLDTLA
jgi:uncharacterized protein YndB with AHSA1/START domain